MLYYLLENTKRWIPFIFGKLSIAKTIDKMKVLKPLVYSAPEEVILKEQKKLEGLGFKTVVTFDDTPEHHFYLRKHRSQKKKPKAVEF